MLNSCATHLTDYLMTRAPIEESRRSVLIYGFELFLSTMASTISICILSLLFRAFYTFLVFIVVFIGIRLFAGGYHAKNYIRCFLLTNSVYLLIYITSISIPTTIQGFLLPLLIFCSTATILFLAPIRHKNHPLTEETYQRNRRIAWVITLLISVVLLLLIYFAPTTLFLPFTTITLAAVAVMMVIPKFLERRT